MKYLLDTNIWILMAENHQSVPLKMMSTILKPDNYPLHLFILAYALFSHKLVTAIPPRP
jgi:hypothetical protein